MKIGTTTWRIARVLVAIAALIALTGSAQATTTKPDRLSTDQYRALVLRSEALNQKYRLGQWKGMPPGMTAPVYRAIMIRSEALNKQYGLGRWSKPAASSPQAPGVVSHGFGWGAFGIGAVAMLALMLLAASVIAGRRLTHETPRIHAS